jgi:hypothetical protein
MCDYSLAHYPNRLACEGEQLVVHRFASGARGLAPARPSLKQLLFPNSTPAVCVPPGARLLLRDIPESLQRKLDVSAVEEVTFVQLSAEAFTYRDAVRFSNGRGVLLQSLASGQRVDVLRLSGAPEEAEQRHDRKQEQPDRDVALSPRVLPTIPLDSMERLTDERIEVGVYN